MTLDQAIERDYRESAVVAVARAAFPNVPEELMRSLFATGFAMGSLHGFADARYTLETTLMEHARGTAH